MPIGVGLQIFPDKRFQIITEYDGLIYVGKGIQNTTQGARDPVDSVMGFRLYALKNLALDVGYRYNLNLTNHEDRNGFVVKLAFARWPEKPLPPDNVTATCSADKTSVMEGSNDFVTATVAGDRCERTSAELFLDGFGRENHRHRSVCPMGFDGRRWREL